MALKQVSVFIQNKVGQLNEIVSFLAEKNVNLRALTIADTAEFGILRIIVDDPEATTAALTEAGYSCSETEVLGVAVPDEPGSLVKVLALLKDGGINIEYTYVLLLSKPGSAYMIFRVDDNDKAAAALIKDGIEVLSAEALLS